MGRCTKAVNRVLRCYSLFLEFLYCSTLLRIDAYNRFRSLLEYVRHRLAPILLIAVAALCFI